MTWHAHADALIKSDFESLLDGAKQPPAVGGLEAMITMLVRQ
jgi:hypothetical protein